MDDNHENRLRDIALDIKLNSKTPLSTGQQNQNLRKHIFDTDSLVVDISRNYLNSNIFRDLIKLATKLKINKSIEDLFTNKYISTTESKKVSHIYLRNKQNLNKTLEKNIKLYEDIIKGKLRSKTSEKFAYIIYVGIGGSLIGPKILSESLKDYHTKSFKCFYVSSADYSEIDDALKNCELDKTLFIFASKSFTTKEVLMNLSHIKSKYIPKKSLKDVMKSNFLAITANANNAKKEGFASSKIISFSKNIPGRFSLTSPISLPVLFEIGKKNYLNFFKGINQMDNHVRASNYKNNIPLILALISIWNINFLDKKVLSICPYNFRLRNIVDHLQQQEMESNGKSFDKEGKRIYFSTSPIVFGQRGSECQHSFFQMIHQGAADLSIDFIGVIDKNIPEASKFLLSNMIAQADLCFSGKKNKPVYKTINHGTPNNIILMKDLSPKSMGMLLSLYEHKFFLEGLLWNINSFDQWGVEQGKILAKKIQSSLNKKLKDTDSLVSVVRNFFN